MKCVKCKMPIEKIGLDRCFCPVDTNPTTNGKIMSKDVVPHFSPTDPGHKRYKDLAAIGAKQNFPVESLKDLPTPPVSGLNRIWVKSGNWIYESFDGSPWYLIATKEAVDTFYKGAIDADFEIGDDWVAPCHRFSVSFEESFKCLV